MRIEEEGPLSTNTTLVEEHEHGDLPASTKDTGLLADIVTLEDTDEAMDVSEDEEVDEVDELARSCCPSTHSRRSWPNPLSHKKMKTSRRARYGRRRTNLQFRVGSVGEARFRTRGNGVGQALLEPEEGELDGDQFMRGIGASSLEEFGEINMDISENEGN